MHGRTSDGAADRLRVDEVRTATAAEWDRAFVACPHATYFHSREWLEIWAAVGAGRLRPAPTTACFSDGTSAVLVLTRERRRGARWPRALSSPAGTYGGWLAGPETGAAHRRLLTTLMGAAASELWWRVNPLDPVAGELEGGIRGGMTVQGDDTHVLMLGSGYAALAQGFSRGHRSAVSKARRHGVRVRRAVDADDWGRYLLVVSDSLERWGARGGGADYPGELFARLRASSATTLWLAEHDGSVVAGALCLSTPRHVVYWHGAALAAAFESRPSTLLLATAIEDACARGAEWFDFNPSGGLTGVREFKRRFGAHALPSPVIVHARRHVRASEWLLRRAGRRRSRPMQPKAGEGAVERLDAAGERRDAEGPRGRQS